MHQHIGDQLKKARESRKMRQEDMALKLGISSRQYQKYEDGEFPKFKTEPIKQIDAILGTNIYEQVYEQEVQQMETKKPPSNDEGLKDKYIALLERQVQDQAVLIQEMDARTKEINKHISTVAANLVSADQTAKIALAYCKTLFVRLTEHFARVEGHLPKKLDQKHLDAAADDMDKQLARQLEEVFQQVGGSGN
jgi:transcriptional regulator with XRE-family HTH domain